MLKNAQVPRHLRATSALLRANFRELFQKTCKKTKSLRKPRVRQVPDIRGHPQGGKPTILGSHLLQAGELRAVHGPRLLPVSHGEKENEKGNPDVTVHGQEPVEQYDGEPPATLGGELIQFRL